MEKLFSSYLMVLLQLLTNSEALDISNGESLKTYLCSPNKTIPPNTDLVITVANITFPEVDQAYCLVENTANVAIRASEDLVYNNLSYVSVECVAPTGFRFLNVSNLTMKFLHFENCENLIVVPSMDLPAIWISLFFQHSYNLTLYNVLANSNRSDAVDIFGLNLCGNSEIHVMMSDDISAEMSVVIHYIDNSTFIDSSECNIAISANKFSSKSVTSQDLAICSTTTPTSIQAYALSICLMQQSFTVLAHINITQRSNDTGKSINIVISFLSNATGSKVVFQGYPYHLCSHDYRGKFMPVTLNAVFNASGGGELVVHDTAFVNDAMNYNPKRLLSINSSGPGAIRKIYIQNVSVCKNLNYAAPSLSMDALLCAEHESESGIVYLVIENVTIFDRYDENYFSQSDKINLMKFKDTSVQFEGTNTFNSSGGGAAIRASKYSDIILSGVITIVDDYLYESNGIVLESESVLHLKEPLKVTFYNKRASQGSAINARKSDINIFSNKSFTLGNLTSIEIAFHFKNSCNSSINTQIYAPQFNFLHWDFSEPSILKEWDYYHQQYAYTTVIDSILKNISDYDKFTSLSNGLCLKAHGQLPWMCKYIDSSYHFMKNDSSYHFMKNDTAYVMKSIEAHPGGIAFAFDPLDSMRKYTAGSDMNVCYESTIESNFGVLEVFSCNSGGSNFSTDVNVTTSAGGFFDVTFLKLQGTTDCPLGFKMAHKEQCSCQCECRQCECTKALKETKFTCDISTLQFTAPGKYWTGLVQHNETDTILFGSNCPPHYCDFSHLDSFALDASLTDLACLNNRAGILCGQCRDNFSAMFGSDKCSHCSNLSILTLPVYALAGLLLVVVLFALRLTVAIGTINGVIFYANILGLVMDVVSEKHNGGYLKVVHVIFSLLNLNLGFPVCLYDGMTPTAAIGFQFIFPVYLWSLVLGMVILSRYSIKVANFISKSSVQVLATLFYLSFSSLLRTVIDVISPVTLHMTVYNKVNREYNTPSTKVVWFYAGLDYGEGIHGFYLALAFLFVLFFLLPFTIFTTFSHSLLRFKLVDRFRPFIEAYGGPFRNKRRFWFGVRLWITIVLFLVDSILQGLNTHTMLVIYLIVIGTFCLFQARTRPFKKFKFTGLLDASYMLNLLFILLVFLILKNEKLIFVYYKILLSEALVALFLSLLYHLWCIRHYISCYQFQKNSYEVIGEGEAEDSDDSLFDAAKNREPVNHDIIQSTL